MSNADKLSSGTKIEIGGVEREIKLNLGAWRRVERETGKNVANGELWKNPGIDEIVVIVWAGINDKTLSIDDVGDMLDLSDLPRINEALGREIARANGKPENEKKSDE